MSVIVSHMCGVPRGEEDPGTYPSPVGSPGFFLQHIDQHLLVPDCRIIHLYLTAAYKDLKKGSESVWASYL